jgi:hypothetical protein
LVTAGWAAAGPAVSACDFPPGAGGREAGWPAAARASAALAVAVGRSVVSGDPPSRCPGPEKLLVIWGGRWPAGPLLSAGA